MNREDIIRMAREAGFETKRDMVWVDQVELTRSMERFAALVAEAEHEACLLELGNTANRLEESVKIIRNLLGK